MIRRTVGVRVAACAAVAAAAVLLAQSGGAASAQRTVSNVYRIPGPPAPEKLVLGASSTLVRTDQGMTMTLHTHGLDPGNAYTVWWVIFNHPEECVGGCGPDDVAAGRAGRTVVYAAGHVLGGDGIGQFGAHVRVDDPPADPRQIEAGDGRLTNPRGAEVHLVARSHGDPVPGLVDDQISSFGGGCTPDTDPTGLGPFGPNACRNRQFSVHLPPQ